MNNTNRMVSGRIGRSRRTGLLSLLILATVTSGLGMGMAVPSVAYADGGPTLNCSNSGGDGGAGGNGGTATGANGGNGGSANGGNDNGNGGTGGDADRKRGGDANGGNRDGNGGNSQAGDGGDVSSNGGQGGEGGKLRQKCVLVSTVVNVSPTIEIPSVSTNLQETY